MCFAKYQQQSFKSTDANLANCCILLDFSKAFNTVDHQILVRKFENCFGICGVALKSLVKSLSVHKNKTS